MGPKPAGPVPSPLGTSHTSLAIMIICPLSVYPQLWAYVNNQGGGTTEMAKRGPTQGPATKGVLSMALSGLREYRTDSSEAWWNIRRFRTAGRDRKASWESFSSYRLSRTAGVDTALKTPCLSSGYILPYSRSPNPR